jgi:hypothetical protein
VNERTANRVVYGFTVLSALLVPVSSLIEIPLLSPTFFAGGTLVMIYLVANPRLLLVTTRSEREGLIREGTAIRIALYLGGLLMTTGLILAGVKISAT